MANPNFKKKAPNNKKPYNKKAEKPKYTKIQVDIAASDFYADSIDSLYNLLDSISFDKVAVPVKIAKSKLFNKPELKGTVAVGTIEKFTGNNKFSIILTEENAANITDEYVMSVRCKKDWSTGDITYCYEFCLVKGESINSQYNDIEEAFTESEKDSAVEDSDTTVEDTAVNVCDEEDSN